MSEEERRERHRQNYMHVQVRRDGRVTVGRLLVSKGVVSQQAACGCCRARPSGPD
jgi:hypothetical protein